MLISFSGLDGAGKSTVIAELRAALDRGPRRVVVLHMNDDVGLYAYARKLRDRVAGPRRHRRRRGDGHPVGRLLSRAVRAVVWSRWLRRLVYPVDLVVFLAYRAVLEGMARRIVVTDRYFYDTLVDVSDGRRWGWVRFLWRLTPTPDVPVFLETEPDQAYARKPEYPLSYLQARWTAYRQVRSWVPSAVGLKNGDVRRAATAIQRLVFDRMRIA